MVAEANGISGTQPRTAMDGHEPAPGVTVDGRYVLTREIARGTFSVVFEAKHRHLGRAVVIKFPMRGPQYESYAARLMREARALDVVRHPGVVDVIDAGHCQTFGYFLAMEKLEGRTLDGILASRYRLGPVEVARIGRDLADALARVHARGVFHRDLKPSNVFVAWNARGEESARLLDFGVSFVGTESLERTDRRLTVTGQVLGTPEYMSPEQLMAQHDRIDARSDVFGLGVTLWECLTGDIPVSGTYPEILQYYAQNRRVPSIRAYLPQLHAGLAAAIDRALEREPTARHADMASFARALDAAFPDAPPTQLLGSPAPAQANASQPAPIDAAAQRRKFPRAPYLAHARILRANEPSIDGRTEDISEAGMLIVLPAGCRKDERVNVRFALPTSGAVVTVPATVRWVREGRGRLAAGLEFDSPTADVRLAIARYVELMGAR